MDLLPQLGRTFLSVLLIIFVPQSIANESFERAMDIYNSGNFIEAKAAFETLAGFGDTSSLFNLGVMHYRGEAVKQDPLKAYALMKVASLDTDAPQFETVASQVYGTFSDAEKAEAEVLFQKISWIYSVEHIRETLLPQLIDDEDCPPEKEPIKQQMPRYPQWELARGKMGVTYVDMTISPEGYSRDVMVTQTAGDGFSKASVEALKGFVYEASADGKPEYGFRIAFVYMIAGDPEVRTWTIKRQLKELHEKAESNDPIYQYAYAMRLKTFRHHRELLKGVDLQYRTANDWLIKSAQQGLPHAQFELGVSMIKGRGCEVDAVNGYKWISAAALGGYSPAQTVLAQKALEQEQEHYSQEQHATALHWLNNAAQSDDYEAKLLLAWELSTSDNEGIRDGERALILLDSDTGDYYDDIRILETQAAAYAEQSSFKKAVKYQKKALKLAGKNDWEIPLMSQRLKLYEDRKPYRGEYY